MPDVLDGTGLTVKSLPEIISDLDTGMQSIYGSDINIDSNSPDGQMINLFGQACGDLRELLVQVNAGFDPDQALGVVLDQRAAINNIQRQGGTFTIIPVAIVTNATITLQGLDDSFNDPNGTGYTVQDSSGNQFILVDSVTLTAGTNSLNFRAQKVGLVETVVNTITIPVTIILGVTSVNNPSGALQIGQNEETDAQLRIRRQNSVSNASTGYLNGLLGTILAITGVTDAKLYENITGTTDANGIPGHAMWAIVEGGANSDIANAIYEKISYGANMKGVVDVPITTASGGRVDILFDRPTAEPLYIRFNIQKTNSLATFDVTALAQYIVNNMTYSIGQFAGVADLYATSLAGITAQGGGGFPTELQISSDNVTYVDYLTTATLDRQFVLDISRINITVL